MSRIVSLHKAMISTLSVNGYRCINCNLSFAVTTKSHFLELWMQRVDHKEEPFKGTVNSD